MPSILKEYWSTNERSSSPEVTWDAFKAYTWRHYISAIKAVKTNQQALTVHLQSGVQNRTDEYALAPSMNFDLLQVSKRALHLHLEGVTRLSVHNTKQQFYEQGDKNAKLLSMMWQHDAPITVILKKQVFYRNSMITINSSYDSTLLPDI